MIKTILIQRCNVLLHLVFPERLSHIIGVVLRFLTHSFHSSSFHNVLSNNLPPTSLPSSPPWLALHASRSHCRMSNQLLPAYTDYKSMCSSISRRERRGWRQMKGRSKKVKWDQSAKNRQRRGLSSVPWPGARNEGEHRGVMWGTAELTSNTGHDKSTHTYQETGMSLMSVSTRVVLITVLYQPEWIQVYWLVYFQILSSDTDTSLNTKNWETV